MRKCRIALSVFIIIIGCVSCSSSSHDSLVTLKGSVAFPDESGVFELSFDGETDSEVTGTLIYDGVTYDLTGTYDSATGTVTAGYTATDPQFTLTGEYSSGSEFSGTIVRNVGGTEILGTISGQEETGTDTQDIYLGTFGNDDSDDDRGTWNMSILNDSVTGTYSYPAGSGKFSGSVSGSDLTVDTFFVYDSSIESFQELSEMSITGNATGTFSDGYVDGSWSWVGDSLNWNGLFTGTLQE